MASMRRVLSKLRRGMVRRFPWVTLMVSPVSRRENGISLIVNTKNEEWIGPSLRSTKDLADEIVLVDTSTDDTPNIIQETALEEDLNLKLIRYPERTSSVLSDAKTITDQFNIALRNTHFRWLFKWDGDFVARTSGKFNIAKLREEVLGLNNKRKYYRKHYSVFLTYVNLDGDLFHTFDRIVRPSEETHLYSYHSKLVCTHPGRFPIVRKAFFYRELLIKEIYIFHLRSVKSAKRLLYRQFETDWRETKDYARFPTLQEYINYRIRRDWKIKDVDEAARFNLAQLCKRLIPYDKDRYGDYPDLLREEVNHPKYKLICRRGKIVGRNDVGILEA